jgi:serine/threonine protein phosphatase PrpC
VDQRDDVSGTAATEEQPSPTRVDEAVAGDSSPVAEGSSSPSSDGAPEAAPPSEDAGSDDPSRDAALAPGETLASYTIVRVLDTSPDERIYFAIRRGDAYPFATDGGDIAITLIERPKGGFEALRTLLALDLRHPRLLAPRGLFERDGREYLALDTLLTEDDVIAPTVGDGGHLDPRSALMAGAGLADALGYLHRMRVFHLGISPEVIYIREGRAFLGGMQHATFVPEAEEGSERAVELGARDANALARAMTALAGLAEPSADDDSMVSALREIAANGEASAFESAGDVAGACSAALQTTDRLLALLHVDVPPSRIRVVTGSGTSVGRVRSENQDASACLVVDVQDDYGRDSPVGLFLVADGMGGEARGELASRITARLVAAEVARQLVVPSLALPAFLVTSADGGEALDLPTEHSAAQALGRAAAVANGQVRELARQLGQAAGTTLTAIALVGTRAAIVHVGDSRAYLLRQGTLHTLTEDHSVLARLQAVDHPLLSDPDVYVPRSMLYRSLGQEDELAVDSLEFTLADGDRLLLCSDGLWDEVDSASLERIFAEASSPTECARQLVDLANSSGGHDNSTAVVAFVHAVAAEEAEADAGQDAPPTLGDTDWRAATE